MVRFIAFKSINFVTQPALEVKLGKAVINIVNVVLFWLFRHFRVHVS
jgi:hypothetical protein